VMRGLGDGARLATRFACWAPPPLRPPAVCVKPPAPSTHPTWPCISRPAAEPLNKGSSANIACHLNLLLERHDAGNATAEALLRAMYRAWRAVHNPQRWHAAAASKANWLASGRYIASVNTLMSNRWWAGLNSYSDLSAEEFAATVLQTSAQAGVQQAVAVATSSTASPGARKLLMRYVPPKTDYPVAINWVTAGRVSVGRGARAGAGAKHACALAVPLLLPQTLLICACAPAQRPSPSPIPTRARH